MSEQSDQMRMLMSNELPADYVLNSIYEIENALTLLESIGKKVDFFKELKKFRTKSVDSRIKELSEKSAFLRQVVLRTMQQLDDTQRTFQFPSIGKVSRRKGRDSWQIDDEKAVLEFLDKQGIKDQVVEMKEVVDTRKLKKLLDEIPNAESVPGVTKKTGEENISITYETPDADTLLANNEQPRNLLDLDTLTMDDL